MSDSGDSLKYKWTADSTSLLVSVWSDRQVQKQLECSIRPHLIWESVAKYMRRKGYEVSAKQCRSRMKQVLVCYKEAKKTGTSAGIERYYESIDKVLETKRSEKAESTDDGTDTVDSVPIIMKSPPKDLKTTKNLQMRHNEYQDPPISLNRHIEVVPGVWPFDREECAESSESNETVVMRPHRCFSPMKNAATSTVSESMKLPGKFMRRSVPIDDRFRYENLDNERFSEIPMKNSVQNVQNHIIQENMMLRNQLAQDNVGIYQPNDYLVNIQNPPGPRQQFYPQNITAYHPKRITTNMARMQSQLQQYSLNRNSAMPQEPRKLVNFGDLPTNGNYRRNPMDYSPDIAPNINDAICQTTKNNKVHNLNETYDQQMFFDNDIPCQMNATTLTNNATFNDDTLSIDFIQDSPSPSENDRVDAKNDSYDNRQAMPDVPVRKKKAQKLEQLMLNAITSQTDVVNKILAAQDSMVNRILDLDQDRQNRMENRLDQLMNVVQATVMNKSSDSKESSDGSTQQQSIPPPVCFSPPPRPGVVPPKLDLVPPKPCRVPCTTTTGDFVNQNPVQSQSNISAPTKPGTIWAKLGPVSQSPFVRAQQQISAVTRAADHWRMKSSAERRIASAFEPLHHPQAMIRESEKFLEAEKLMEARIENARRLMTSESEQSFRRQLFEPTKEEKPVAREHKPLADAILTTTFLNFERQAEDKLREMRYRYDTDLNETEELLTGQGESYERLRSLSLRVKPKQPTDRFVRIQDDKMDTSTPAKPARADGLGSVDYCDEPRQTIQQLAELVMNSARWCSAEAARNLPPNTVPPFNNNNNNDRIPVRPSRESEAQRQSRDKALNWLQDRYTYGKPLPEPLNDTNRAEMNFPMGFVHPNANAQLNIRDENIPRENGNREIGFMRNNYERPHDILDNRRSALRQREAADKYGYEARPRVRSGDEDEDDEFLDTTTTLHKRNTSMTSTSTGAASKSSGQCVVS